MRFQCTFCRSTIRGIGAEHLGNKIKCPHCGRMEVLPKSPYGIGRIIGDFIINTKVGSGSIGAVYLAKQISLDRMVALKILSEKYTNEKGIASFLSEARAVARLNHPNIVQVFAVGEQSGICFMAMNFIQGKTLKKKIEDEGRIPVDESLHIVQQVSEGLYAAWEEEKLIHRDVKPENIIINSDKTAKLTDLGLAIHQKDCKKGMEISGTPYYMSPEQFAGEQLDTRADIYSLGITLYQMLSGKLPYEGKTLNTVAKQHFYENPTPLVNVCADVPKAVSELVDKMIAKHPDDRYRNMDDLLKAIWQIRQKTAPSKDLIPGVHTISLKKLDYKVPEPEKKPAAAAHKPVSAASAMAESMRREEEDSNVKIRMNKGVLLFVLLILFIVAAIFAANAVSKRKLQYNRENEARRMETWFARTTGYNNELAEECNKLITAIGTPKDDAQAALIFRMRLLLSQMEYRGQLSKNELLTMEIDALKAKHETSVKDLQNENERSLLLLASRKEGELVEKIKVVENEKASLMKEIESLKRKIDESNVRLRETERSAKDLENEALLSKLNTAIHQNKFPEANLVLGDLMANSSEKEQKTYESIRTHLERMPKELIMLKESGARYNGVSTPEGIVVKIFDGIITLNTGSGFVTKKWESAQLDTLYAIVSSEFKDIPEDEIKCDLALITGCPGTALKLLPKDKALFAMVSAMFNTSARNLKYQIAIDKKKAQLKVQAFIKEFDGISEFSQTIDEIKKLADTSSIPSSSSGTSF